jgi:hypothetical protein
MKPANIDDTELPAIDAVGGVTLDLIRPGLDGLVFWVAVDIVLGWLAGVGGMLLYGWFAQEVILPRLQLPRQLPVGMMFNLIVIATIVAGFPGIALATAIRRSVLPSFLVCCGFGLTVGTVLFCLAPCWGGFITANAVAGGCFTSAFAGVAYGWLRRYFRSPPAPVPPSESECNPPGEE